MTFSRFQEKTPAAGLACNKVFLGTAYKHYPLEFSLKAKDLLENLDSNSDYDDLKSDLNMNSFKEGFSKLYPNYIPFAELDYKRYLEMDPDAHIDSYCGFVFFVDVSSESNRVLIFAPEYTNFPELFPTFSEFIASLIDAIPWKSNSN